MLNRRNTVVKLVVPLLVLAASLSISSQTISDRGFQAKDPNREAGSVGDADLLDAQRRAFAISLVMSLADEARTYRDVALRPRVLARAADTLWTADSNAARLLFRRAWEAAEKGDADEVTLKTSEDMNPSSAAMITTLRRIAGHDLRAEVLALAARRDRALGEEFLNKLKDETKRETETRSTADADTWLGNESASKRLQLANRLLTEGAIDRAVEFALPVLNSVNPNSIGFLSALRLKRPEIADQKFAALLVQAEFDPSSDANTVSGLSSYVFTPQFYVTFSPDGNARWTQPDEPTAPPNLSPSLRMMFFKSASNILLRPLPPPDQDFTTSGRIGKYMVIKRLLPLFDQYAPELGAALRPQLTTLTSGPVQGTMTDVNPLLNQGLKQDEAAGAALERMQNQLDRAKTSRERDAIYAETAVVLAIQGDARAREVADKIDETDPRNRVRGYVDFQLIYWLIHKNDAAEALKLATAGQLTHTQRSWAYAQAARLLMKSQRQPSLDLLQEAADEARRIDADLPDRAYSLIAVATQLVEADRVRAWEIMNEAVKAANSVEKFDGDNMKLVFPMMTKAGLKVTEIGGEDFGVSRVLRELAKDDLDRSLVLAKSFKNDAPRATSILTIANALLTKEPARQAR